jgi:hypothetical protein
VPASDEYVREKPPKGKTDTTEEVPGTESCRPPRLNELRSLIDARRKLLGAAA